MEREDVKELLMIVQVYYPNFKPVDKSITIDAWYDVLKDYDVRLAKAALKIFVTSGGQFAPAVGEIVKIILGLAPKSKEMTGLEAWQIVRKAISNGNYHAQEEFEKMPEQVQKALGGYDQIRIWASDTEFNESVAQSNFIKSYQMVKQREKLFETMPSDVKQLIADMQKEERLLGYGENESG